MATHCSTLAWRTPWTEEPDVLTVHGVVRGRHNLATKLPPPSHCDQRPIRYPFSKFLQCFPPFCEQGDGHEQ